MTSDGPALRARARHLVDAASGQPRRIVSDLCTMALIGLVRVTRDACDVERQHEALDPICVRVFEEEASRRRLIENRPQLLVALEQLGTDDRLVVTKVRHLAQSMVNGWEVLIDLVELGVAVRVLEGSDAGDYDEVTDIREGAREVTEIRRALLSERIKKGLQSSRERGDPGGRPRVVSHETRIAIFTQRGQGETLRAIAQSIGVSIGTVHAVLSEDQRPRSHHQRTTPGWDPDKIASTCTQPRPGIGLESHGHR